MFVLTPEHTVLGLPASAANGVVPVTFTVTEPVPVQLLTSVTVKLLPEFIFKLLPELIVKLLILTLELIIG